MGYSPSLTFLVFVFLVSLAHLSSIHQLDGLPLTVLLSSSESKLSGWY